jgi:APA family basic amino acid/polyamine antiporter
MAKLKHDLGVWGAASIGIGAIIGTGIFVLLGVAAGLAGSAVIFSFIIAGVTALITGLSSAELASFITEEGGSYIYTTKAFGKFLGFVVGWLNSFDYMVGLVLLVLDSHHISRTSYIYLPFKAQL